MKITAQLEPSKVAVITGGSSGIGKAISCELAKRGMDVWLVAQQRDILEKARLEVETYRQHSNQLIDTVSADVTDLTQVKKAIEKISEKSATLDILINSAGVAHPGYVQELDISIFNWMMEVNYFGTVNMTKEILRIMLQKSEGYIVNISSMAGIISIFGYTAYGASKYAIKGFSDALRQEMKFQGIGVSIVFPSDTDTPQLEYENRFKPPETKSLGSMSGSMSPQDVAKVTLSGIEHGKYIIIPGLEGKIFYRLSGLLGAGLNPIMDHIIADSVKKRKSSQSKEA
jgi:3-dehydrosphinganine reductase